MGDQVSEGKMACAGARIEFTPSGKSMTILISEINEMSEAEVSVRSAEVSVRMEDGWAVEM